MILKCYFVQTRFRATDRWATWPHIYTTHRHAAMKVRAIRWPKYDVTGVEARIVTGTVNLSDREAKEST